MPYGYNGKILHIDLSSALSEVETPPEVFYRKYMGGSALNLYYLLKGIPPGIDPLGSENILALSVSAVTGTPISGQSRLTASSKSPLTGCIGDSQSGGFWPAELKFTGFDAIINNCKRANGRTGMGAAMGSKNLEAIAVRGTRKPFLADQDAFRQLVRRGTRLFPDSMIAGMGKYGTTDSWKLDPSEFEDALDAYYGQAGWDIASGMPVRQTLDRLGLSWVLKDHCHENGS